MGPLILLFWTFGLTWVSRPEWIPFCVPLAKTLFDSGYHVFFVWYTTKMLLGVLFLKMLLEALFLKLSHRELNRGLSK